MHEAALTQGTIRYRDDGDGPPIVFIHGLLVSASLWRDVTPALAPRHRCIVPDWPLGSHSIALAPDADLSPPGVAALVAAFLDHLDLRDVTLVGNDSGGAICQLVAARHGARVGRLVLTTCDAFEVFPPKRFGYLKWLGRSRFAMAALAKMMHALPVLARTPVAYGSLARTRIPNDLLAEWSAPSARDPSIRRDVAKFVRGVSADHTLAVAEELRDFRKPALLVWSERDPLFPLELARRLVAVLPDARLETVDARTFVPLDQPARLAELIARFVAEVRCASATFA